MSNIFLATALIKLAEDAAGCNDEENKSHNHNATMAFNETMLNDDTEVDDDECKLKIYGFQPTSLITNIAVISGLMSAFLMPVIGSIVDFTSYRRMVAIFGASTMVLIQAIQIGTGPKTWFFMAILQAIAGFLYQVKILALYAYLPDIARDVGQLKMTDFTSSFQISQFSNSLLFLIFISGVNITFGLSDVVTAQISQATTVVYSGFCFLMMVKMISNVPALQKLPEGKTLITAGFAKIIKNTKGIYTHYKGTVWWFFIAVVFAEAGFNAFTTVSVTYLIGVLEMNGGEIGIIFAVVYISTVPGSLLGAKVTKKTNPVLSWKINIITFILINVSGAFVLVGPDQKTLVYIWGVLWGIGLGWHYPTEKLIFSLCVPKGQEAELTGYYVYTTQIIVWLPPLIFTSINESGLHMKYGLLSLVIFFFLAWCSLMRMDKWSAVLEAAAAPNKMFDIEVA